MPYEKWDVVFTCVPNQEDTSKYTRRPAIVLDIKGGKAKICPITTQLYQMNRYHYTILVKRGTKEFNSMGLLTDSLIVLDRIAEIDVIRIERKFGACYPATRIKITSILKELGYE